MTQAERREFLISRLLKEQPEYTPMKMPADAGEQKKLLRSLFNIRMPEEADEEFIKIQNEYLWSEAREKGITQLSELSPIKQGIEPLVFKRRYGDKRSIPCNTAKRLRVENCQQHKIYLWQGDITTLRVDAIVNAANSQMLGCFYPCHGCIDNAIHTYAGIQLRNECHRKMEEKRRIYGRDYEEPTGRAMVTEGYNLPCNYVIHTVGPIVSPIASVQLRKEDCKQLAGCYLSCLEAALLHNIKSIAFCCISTGEFHFPNEKAARIAVETVGEFLKSSGKRMEVVFNVFKDIDYEIYRELLTQN